MPAEFVAGWKVSAKESRQGLIKDGSNTLWQKVDIHDSASTPDASFITDKVDTALLQNYDGGEATSREYVEDFDQAGMGEYGTASWGDITSSDTVWQDAGLKDKNQANNPYPPADPGPARPWPPAN